MMKSYTLHLPAGAPADEAAALERAALVRDGFSWPAFLFLPLWFFWHRLWLAGLLVLVGLAAFVGAGVVLNLRPGAAALATLLVCALVGLEASSLRRWTYARRGRPAADVVTAGSRAEAEAKAVARHVARQAATAVAPARREPGPIRGRPFPVIGLFPEEGGR